VFTSSKVEVGAKPDGLGLKQEQRMRGVGIALKQLGKVDK